ncbi:hypothetical protein Hanom_Chr04g00381731 [Helianthus anomalus]
MSKSYKNFESTRLECVLQLLFRKFFYLKPEIWSKLWIFTDRSILRFIMVLNG